MPRNGYPRPRSDPEREFSARGANAESYTVQGRPGPNEGQSMPHFGQHQGELTAEGSAGTMERPPAVGFTGDTGGIEIPGIGTSRRPYPEGEGDYSGIGIAPGVPYPEPVEEPEEPGQPEAPEVPTVPPSCRCELRVVRLSGIGWQEPYHGYFDLIGNTPQPGPYEIFCPTDAVVFHTGSAARASPFLRGSMKCGEQARFMVQPLKPGRHMIVARWGNLVCTEFVGEDEAPQPPDECVCAAACIDPDNAFETSDSCTLVLPNPYQPVLPGQDRSFGFIAIKASGPANLDIHWTAESQKGYVLCNGRPADNDLLKCGHIAIVKIEPSDLAIAQLQTGAPSVADTIHIWSDAERCADISITIARTFADLAIEQYAFIGQVGVPPTGVLVVPPCVCSWCYIGEPVRGQLPNRVENLTTPETPLIVELQNEYTPPAENTLPLVAMATQPTAVSGSFTSPDWAIWAEYPTTPDVGKSDRYLSEILAFRFDRALLRGVAPVMESATYRPSDEGRRTGVEVAKIEGVVQCNGAVGARVVLRGWPPETPPDPDNLPPMNDAGNPRIRLGTCEVYAYVAPKIGGTSMPLGCCKRVIQIGPTLLNQRWTAWQDNTLRYLVRRSPADPELLWRSRLGVRPPNDRNSAQQIIVVAYDPTPPTADNPRPAITPEEAHAFRAPSGERVEYIAVTSVADLLNQLQDLTSRRSPQRCIRQLVISAHGVFFDDGSRGGFALGQDYVGVEDPDGARQFGILVSNLMCVAGTIDLWVCWGATRNTLRLLGQMSGCRVRGTVVAFTVERQAAGTYQWEASDDASGVDGVIDEYVPPKWFPADAERDYGSSEWGTIVSPARSIPNNVAPARGRTLWPL